MTLSNGTLRITVTPCPYRPRSRVVLTTDRIVPVLGCSGSAQTLTVEDAARKLAELTTRQGWTVAE